MGSTAILSLALAITVMGSLVVYVRHRRAASIESGVDDFRREMRALAPPSDDRRRTRGS